MDYEQTENEIERRIKSLLFEHPELLEFESAWDLRSVGLDVDDLRPSEFQVAAAFNAVKEKVHKIKENYNPEYIPLLDRLPSSIKLSDETKEAVKQIEDYGFFWQCWGVCSTGSINYSMNQIEKYFVGVRLLVNMWTVWDFEDEDINKAILASHSSFLKWLHMARCK